MDEPINDSTLKIPEKECQNDETGSSQNSNNPDPVKQPDSIPGMTLEQIIDITGEFSHLNELVMLHLEYSGGYVGADAYFRTVQPILDLLEVEIRVRCNAGINIQQMKLMVQDWIDQEIKDISAKCGTTSDIQSK